MGKRVDFSLGMQGISSGADFGNVYEDRKPMLPPTITTTSPSPGLNRLSRDRSSDDGGSLAQTSSRDSQMGRIMSGGSNKTHRNRFFSRGKSKLGNAEEGTSLQDLEAGTREFGIGDMPDIPEASGANSASWGAETEKQLGKEVRFGDKSRSQARRETVGDGRIDPRTGIVSPQAVARDSALERGELPMVMARPRRAVTEMGVGGAGRGRK